MANNNPELQGLKILLEDAWPLAAVNPPPFALGFWSGEPRKPLTRKERIRTRIWLRQHNARSRIARLIAPWLSNDWD